MSPFPPAAEFAALAPEILLAVFGCAILVAGAIGRGLSHRLAAGLTLASFAAAAVALVVVRPEYAAGRLILNGGYALDPYALFWKALVIVGGALSALVSLRFVEEGGYRPGEYYALLLLAATGMTGMASGYNLLTIWISLELMALSSYVLTGYFRDQTRSHEAALKYFVLGALSSGVLLYGISLIYGATGTLQIDRLAAATAAAGRRACCSPSAGSCCSSGLLFKVAAVPFHVWTPDVYTGAPTPVTAFLAAGSKAISFAVIVRILFQGLPGLAGDWKAVAGRGGRRLTMIWGNLAALTQRNVKRMLAYSSIAHAGYVLIGGGGGQPIGSWALLLLPRLLRLRHLRRLRHRHPARAARVRRGDDRRLRRPRRPGALPRRRHGDLPARPDRHPADRRIRRQALPLRRGDPGGLGLAGGDRRPHQRHVALLLLPAGGGDVPAGRR